MNNQPAIVLNRWTQPGEIAPVQQFTQNTGSEAYQAWFNASGTGDNIISDASFIRLKNLSITYHFAKNWLERNHLQDIRIYVQAQNLFTISHYQGLDPESQSNSVLPPLRVLTAGIQIIF
jgi:hypothetical protein